MNFLGKVSKKKKSNSSKTLVLLISRWQSSRWLSSSWLLPAGFCRRMRKAQRGGTWSARMDYARLEERGPIRAVWSELWWVGVLIDFFFTSPGVRAGRQAKL